MMVKVIHSFFRCRFWRRYMNLMILLLLMNLWSFHPSNFPWVTIVLSAALVE